MENIDEDEVEILVTELTGTEENDYRKAGKFCDFKLKFHNTEDWLEVHKVVLASKCPYFKALFECEMIECVNGYLEFKENITHSELENIITYLYTGHFKIKMSEAKIYYQHALYFRLENLTNFCKAILIKSIKIDNCLDLWRFGAIFCNDLEIAAFEYILQNSTELFNGDTFFVNITEKEIIDIVSNDKVTCSEDKVYSFVMKWLNFDFDNRNHILNDLIQEIRFELVDNKFLTSEILNNDILLDNKNFLTISKEILKSKLDLLEMSCLKYNKMNTPRIGFRQKTPVALYDSYLCKFDNGEKQNIINTNWYNVQLTSFFKNYLLISAQKSCQYYCPAKNVIYKFPEMKINRQGYGIIELNNNIYCCGGTDDGNIETFDLNVGIWMEGTKMHCKRHNFGIATWENSLYVIGGQHNEDLFERYDPREDQWTFLPSISGNSNKSFMRSFTYDEKIYSFTLSEGFIFDLKANKWMEEKIKSPSNTWTQFDLTEIDGIVYMAGLYTDNRSNKFFNWRTYNINTNTWLDNRNIGSTCYNISMATIMI